VKNDPFWSQKETKSANLRKILTAIRDKHPTFTELLQQVELSRPVLSDRLRELQGEGRIARYIHGRRIEYQVTDTEKALERQRMTYIANMMQALKGVVEIYSDETAKDLSQLAQLAKEDPEHFEAMMQSTVETYQLLLSDECLRWAKNQSVEQICKKIMNRLPPGWVIKPPKTVSSPEEIPEYLERNQKMLKAVREAIAADKTINQTDQFKSKTRSKRT
jgi:DNA-binding Lrp family transcriptional regulator